jgi:hypothetical protein
MLIQQANVAMLPAHLIFASASGKTGGQIRGQVSSVME